MPPNVLENKKGISENFPENSSCVKISGAPVFVVTFLTIVLLIFTSLYIQWTAVGAPVIDGVQGRYFLPILLLVPIALCRGKNKKTHVTLISERAVLCYSAIVNMAALAIIFMQNK